MAQTHDRDTNNADPVARAAALRELMARNAAQAEHDRRIPKENIRSRFVAGMRGTGSNTLIAREVFVPDHRVLSVSRCVSGSAPARLWLYKKDRSA